MKHTYEKEAAKEAAATTDIVFYEFSLVNDGLLSLYNISMRDSVLKEHGTIITCTDADETVVTGSTPGEVNGLAFKNGLAPAGKLLCIGEDSVTQGEVWPYLALNQFGFSLKYGVSLRPAIDVEPYGSEESCTMHST